MRKYFEELTEILGSAELWAMLTAMLLIVGGIPVGLAAVALAVAGVL
jgi:hypothetical protein